MDGGGGYRRVHTVRKRPPVRSGGRRGGSQPSEPFIPSFTHSLSGPLLSTRHVSQMGGWEEAAGTFLIGQVVECAAGQDGRVRRQSDGNGGCSVAC